MIITIILFAILVALQLGDWVSSNLASNKTGRASVSQRSCRAVRMAIPPTQ